MATGDIGAVIDTLEFDDLDCLDAATIKIGNNIIAVVYTGEGLDGWLKTFSVDSAGEISNAPIDTLEFDATQATHAVITPAYDDIYAIVYADAFSNGIISTVEIDSAGNISAALIDTWTFAAASGAHPAALMRTNGIVIIAFQEAGIAGKVFTVTVSAAGLITNAKIDELTYNATFSSEKRMLHIDGDVYAVVYQGPDADGWMNTFSVDAAGDISNAVIDTLEFDPARAMHIGFCHVNADIYAIIHSDTWSDGWIKTVEIDNAGNIGAAAIDSWEFDNTQYSDGDIQKIGDNVVAVAYRDALGAGEIFTCTINDAGTITQVKIDSLAIGGVQAQIRINRMVGDIYCLSYGGVDGDGWAKSLDIETPADGRPAQMMGML